MKLAQLLKVLFIEVSRDLDLEIGGVSFHSKQVKKGDLFVAIPGHDSDGHRYIKEAIETGAHAVIGEIALDSLPVPYFKVLNARLALAKLGAKFYGNPSQNHTIIGITGTNGKTTTAHMIRHILEHAGQTCSLFGTVECYINGESFPSKMTTYDATQLQRWLHQSIDENVVMEVSSHGLAQHRVDGILFDYALFTNLSHDHLDYHHSMVGYFEAKERLFSLLKNQGEAIINTTTDWGKQLKQKLIEHGLTIYTVGTLNEDTFQLMHVENLIHPTIVVREREQIYSLNVSVPGNHNVWNAMSAIAVARRKGISFHVISEAMGTFPGVPGRFQSFQHPKGARVIVDYAHTPDGLIQCLTTARSYKPRRLVHIFGFRGGKDDSKWENMLEISNAYADETVLTLDDLNGVSIDTMLEWYRKLQNVNTAVVSDRTEAIADSWDRVGQEDCIVITGKGPEPYQSQFNMSSRSDIETVNLLSGSS